MENLSKMKVGKIVARNFKTSKVLTAHGIDFCCGGGITLEEACKQQDIPVETIEKELKKEFKEPDHYEYEQMKPKELIRLIVNVHHKYVETTIPVLKTYLDKLCAVHGERHPELFEIRQLFFSASQALTHHMQKEELVLFPYIQAMCEAKENGFQLSKPHFGDIENPIGMMEEEHETEGERFREIARLSNNYIAPADGCQTYQVAYKVLEEFEQDLHTHIHLENNILFNQARELYEEFEF